MAEHDENKIVEDYFQLYQNQVFYKGEQQFLSSTALGYFTSLEIFQSINILDLSFATLHWDLSALESIPRLEVLILDNCSLKDRTQFPSLPQIETLSLNKNCFTDLELLLTNLDSYNHTLSYLSMLGNPLCPKPIYEAVEDYQRAYLRYRSRVAFRLQNLKFLDSSPVSLEEKQISFMTGHITLTHNVLPTKKNQSNHFYNPTAAQIKEKSKLSNQDDIDAGGSSFSQTSKKTFYGKLRFKYSGKNSEGNRFIKDVDL